MAATTIYFNGRLISTPGAYTEVDASGLEVVGLSASGIVACLGTSIGGKPYDEIGDSDVRGQLQVATNPQKPFEFFRSGHLKEAGPILFAPSDDDDIPGGAQDVVYVKTNPATQSVATFSNALGDALALTSADWGYFTTQIYVEIGAGTDKGKMLTLTFEDTEEVFDDVGGDAMLKIKYLATVPAGGYTTVTATISASALSTAFTLTRAGLDTDITNQVTATQAVEIVSSDAADTMSVTIYGTDTSDNAQWEILALTGTVIKIGTKTWNSIHGAIIASAPAGTVTIQNTPGGTAITTLTAGAMTKGLHTMSDVAVAGVVLSLVRSVAGTEKVTVIGKNASGGTLLETVTLNGTAAVLTTGTWSSITYLAVGELLVAGSTTASALSVNSPFNGNETIQKAADKFNGTPGYTLTVITAKTSYLMADLDYVATPADVLSPAEPSFYADLSAIVEKLNLESALVTAARASGGSGAPDNTTAPVYLAGGNEGSSTPGQEGIPTASNTDWQNAINLLTKIRVNTVVVMTHDPAIHAMVKAHCKYMGGVGRSERDTKLGLYNAGMTGLATKTEAKAQIVDINTKYAAAWAQNIERYNTVGEAEVFPPMYGALILAGMQAGSSVGTAVTHKYMNTLSLEQHTTWNPTDDAEEMIQAGLCFGEVVDGVGRRVVRGVTTHLTSSNIAFTEQSVNEAVGYAVYNYRTQMEVVVGKKGFAGTVVAAHGEAIGILGLLVGVAIVAYRSLATSLTLDVLEQAVEIAPVLPVNFVKSTIHLVSIPQSAAAA